MGWDNRKFRFYLIFGDATGENAPWRHENWVECFEPVFRRIVECSPEYERTGLRVLEYAKKSETDQYVSEVKLGRMKWNGKSHDKWTLTRNDPREFVHFCSWTPIWTICDKKSESPDIYVSIQNERYLGEEHHYEFETLTTIAVAEDLNRNVDEIIIELSPLLQSKISVMNIRAWGRGKHDANGNWEFINSIQDTTSRGIHSKAIKLNFHTIPFESIDFEPYWKVLYRGNQ
jgi:hypothetical protein